MISAVTKAASVERVTAAMKGRACAETTAMKATAMESSAVKSTTMKPAAVETTSTMEAASMTATAMKAAARTTHLNGQRISR